VSKTERQYSIRLAVKDGGKVEAVMSQIGATGEKSFTKLDASVETSNKRLAMFGRAVSMMTSPVGLLSGAVIGAGYALQRFGDQAITAADATAKTADKIGFSTDALQEYRYAAESAGVASNTFDMAAQRFTRRMAEAAKGTGEAKDALAQLGVSVVNSDGSLRRSEDVLMDVADAMKNVKSEGERVRLAFKLFDSEGVAMVNMLAGGAKELENVRQRARDLGIVIEEDLLRNAEAARNELDTLSTVVRANLTSAILGVSPAIADLSKELSELAADAGLFYEQIGGLFSGDFNFDNLSKRGVSKVVKDYRADIQEIKDELNHLGDVNFLTNPIDWGRKQSLEHNLKEKESALLQWSTKLAWMSRNDKPVQAPLASDDTGGGVQGTDEKRAGDALARLREQVDGQRRLNEAREGGEAVVRRVQADLKTEADLRKIQTGFTADQVIEYRKLSVASFELNEATRKFEADSKVKDDLGGLKGRTENLRQLISAYSRSPDAVKSLRNELELEAAQSRLNVDNTTELGRAWTDAFRDGQRLEDVLEDLEKAQQRNAEIGRSVGSAFVDSLREAEGSWESLGDAAENFGWRVVDMMKEVMIYSPLESAISSFAGSFNWGDLFGFGGGSTSVSTLHEGGFAGRDSSGDKSVPWGIFDGAPRFHGGGNLLGPNEVPIIGLRGERMLTEAQQDNTARSLSALAQMASGAPSVVQLSLNVYGGGSGNNGKVAQTTTRQQPGGLDIDVILDEHAARTMRPGGAGLKSLQETHYIAPTLTSRG